MSLVIDCSVAAAWLLPDEDGSAILQLLDRVGDAGAIVPGHWWLEMANTLLMAVRRGRIELPFAQAALTDFSDLGIATDDETSARAWSVTFSLAHRHRLSAYDAAYLELAARIGAPLATLDRTLRDAARREQVAVLPS